MERADFEALTGGKREALGVVMADPDERCPGLWVELDPSTGYCELGDECRNPVRDAHDRRVADWLVEPGDA